MRKKRTTSLKGRSEHIHRVAVTSRRIMYFDALRLLRRLAKLGVYLLILVAFAWAGHRAWVKFVVKNPDFRLTQLELPEGGQVSGARVLEACGIGMDESVFAIDVTELERKLEAMPEVKSAEVIPRYPGTLIVNLVERNPVAWVECEPLGIHGRDAMRGLLVDEEKVLFSCDPDVFERFENLPVISLPELTKEEIGSGMTLGQKVGLRAYDLIRKAEALREDQGLLLPDFDLIRVRSETSLEAILAGETRVVFGLYEHERQLEDLSTILAAAARDGRRLGHVNLIPRRNIPVGYLD